eukprot:Skav236713  [mRNA]  locus=scaffold2096:26959:30370:+ [translate_table: standard]
MTAAYSEAEEKKIAEYSNMCEKRPDFTAADGKSPYRAATSSIQETQQSLAADEADLKAWGSPDLLVAASEVRKKESAEFVQAQKELLEADPMGGIGS